MAVFCKKFLEVLEKYPVRPKNPSPDVVKFKAEWEEALERWMDYLGVPK